MRDSVLTGCKIHTPYPPIAVERENPEYAELLAVPYAGEGGELTSVFSYSFGSLVTKDRSPKDLSAVLRTVAETEMLHASMLGSLIWKLGAKPIFATEQKRPFSALGLDYETDPGKILMSAARAEQSAVAVYEKLMTMIDDRFVIAVLKRISEDEKRHWMIFTEWSEKDG